MFDVIAALGLFFVAFPSAFLFAVLAIGFAAELAVIGDEKANGRNPGGAAA